MFVSFEGGEGCGKSTQAALLRDALAARGIPAICTREPGGSPAAEALREVLLARRDWRAETEALLFAAARAQHVLDTISPALTSGQWVLCDRFLDSTIAYQGRARELGEAWISSLHRFTCGVVLPDITFFLDLSPEKGLERTQRRGQGEQTRFEAERLDFHRRVHEGFLALSRAQPQRIRRIDASRAAEVVHRDILLALGLA